MVSIFCAHRLQPEEDWVPVVLTTEGEYVSLVEYPRCFFADDAGVEEKIRSEGGEAAGSGRFVGK